MYIKFKCANAFAKNSHCLVSRCLQIFSPGEYMASVSPTMSTVSLLDLAGPGTKYSAVAVLQLLSGMHILLFLKGSPKKCPFINSNIKSRFGDKISNIGHPLNDPAPYLHSLLNWCYKRISSFTSVILFIDTAGRC